MVLALRYLHGLCRRYQQTCKETIAEVRRKGTEGSDGLGSEEEGSLKEVPELGF